MLLWGLDLPSRSDFCGERRRGCGFACLPSDADVWVHVMRYENKGPPVFLNFGNLRVE